MSTVRSRTFSIATTAAVLLAAVAVASACGGNDDDPSAAKGQGSLEVYAEVQQAGIGGITQMPDGQLIVGYHPFYQTATSTQIALLNADRKSTTPYPAGLRQTCRNADGSFLPPVNGNYDFCLDWVLGFHTDANGILWILDSVKSTDKADPVHIQGPQRFTRSWSDGIPRRIRFSRSSISTHRRSPSRSTTTSPSISSTTWQSSPMKRLANSPTASATRRRWSSWISATGASRRVLQGDAHVCTESRPDPMGCAGRRRRGRLGPACRCRRHHAGQGSRLSLLRSS